VLGQFSARRDRARYLAFMADEIGEGRRAEFTSARSCLGDIAEGRGRDSDAHDPRILGDGDFVARVVSQVEATDRRRERAGKRLSPREVVQAAAKVAGLPVEVILRPNRRPPAVLGRALVCKWLVEDIGLRGVAVAKLLGVTPAAVSHGVEQGRRIERERGVSPEGVT
jgi:hypothetical protein